MKISEAYVEVGARLDKLMAGFRAAQAAAERFTAQTAARFQRGVNIGGVISSSVAAGTSKAAKSISNFYDHAQAAALRYKRVMASAAAEFSRRLQPVPSNAAIVSKRTFADEVAGIQKIARARAAAAKEASVLAAAELGRTSLSQLQGRYRSGQPVGAMTFGRADLAAFADYERNIGRLGHAFQSLKSQGTSALNALGSRMSHWFSYTASALVRSFVWGALRAFKNLAVGGAIAIAALEYSAVRSGMAFIELRNLSQVTFEGMTKDAIAWTESYAGATRLDPGEIEKNLSTFHNMIRSMGFASQDALVMSKALVQFRGDISSLRNIPLNDAFEKISSGLVGMPRPLQDIGILVNEQAVEQELLARGISKTSGEYTNQQKVLGRMLALYSAARADRGDLIRTLFSEENVLRSVGAMWAQYVRALGMASIKGGGLKTLMLSMYDLIQRLTMSAEGWGAAWDRIFANASKHVLILDVHLERLVARLNLVWAFRHFSPATAAYNLTKGNVKEFMFPAGAFTKEVAQARGTLSGLKGKETSIEDAFIKEMARLNDPEYTKKKLEQYTKSFAEYLAAIEEMTKKYTRLDNSTEKMAKAQEDAAEKISEYSVKLAEATKAEMAGERSRDDRIFRIIGELIPSGKRLGEFDDRQREKWRSEYDQAKNMVEHGKSSRERKLGLRRMSFFSDRLGSQRIANGIGPAERYGSLMEAVETLSKVNQMYRAGLDSAHYQQLEAKAATRMEALAPEFFDAGMTERLRQYATEPTGEEEQLDELRRIREATESFADEAERIWAAMHPNYWQQTQAWRQGGPLPTAQGLPVNPILSYPGRYTPTPGYVPTPPLGGYAAGPASTINIQGTSPTINIQGGRPLSSTILYPPGANPAIYTP